MKKILDGSAAATALILSMFLPNLINPVYAALGAVFAIVVVKYSFGGLGSNWLNPALGGWLFIRISWPRVFSGYPEDPLSVTEMAAVPSVSALGDSVTTFLNDSIFSYASVRIPPGYIDLLFSHNPGIIADRGLFALLVGTVVITAFGINRGWLPLVFLSVYGFLIRFAPGADHWSGDLLYGLFSGGTIAVAFILAAEPGSSAKFKIGILISVIFAAFLSWFFRYRCLEYSGALIALALVNCLVPLVRLIEEKVSLFRNRRGIKQEGVL